MSSPLLWGPNNTSNNLQNQVLLANGELLSNNGPKNYIKNGTFSNGVTTGWDTFLTTLTGKIPTGSLSLSPGTVSLSINTGSTISGTNSLVFSGDNSTINSYGFASSAFTIDASDQAKVLSFKFNYKVTNSSVNCSGTDSNTFAIYIRDVTANTWIQPAGVYNIVQNSGIGTATGTFQTTASSTQYRICLIIINNITGLSLIEVDDVFVGPQVTSIGPAIREMTQFTCTGSWTSNATYTGFYSRVGDTAYLDYKLDLTGAPNNVLLYFNLPPGLSIDTSKPVTETYYGVGNILSTTVDRLTAVGFIDGPNSRIYVNYEKASPISGNPISQNSGLNATTPVTFKNGDVITMRISVPIQGWSTNTVQSSDTDTRVVAASYAESSPQTVNNGVVTNINWPVATVDTTASTTRASGSLSVTTGNWSTNNWYYTAPVSGYYSIDALVKWQPSTSVTGFNFQVVIYKNGSSFFGHTINSPDASGTNSFPISPIKRLVQLNAGDTIDIRASNNVSNTTTVTGVYLNIERLSGPAIVQATETVKATYGSSAGNSIPYNSGVFIDFASKETDSHNSVLGAGSGNNATATSTWRYVAPVSGEYSVNACITIANGATTSTLDYFSFISINGTERKRGNRLVIPTTQSGGIYSNPVSGSFNLKAGDFISIGFYQANGASGAKNMEASTLSNFVSIVREGN